MTDALVLPGPGLEQRPVPLPAHRLDGRRLYRRGYNRVATGGTLRRRYGGAGSTAL